MDLTFLENAKTLWVVHIGNNDRIAARALDEKFICIGWTLLGDLQSLNTRGKLKEEFLKTWPKAKMNSVNSSYGQPFRFAHEMKVGDPVIYPVRNSSEIAIGEITSDYIWANDDKQLRENDYCNIRKVSWIKIVPRTDFTQSALHSFGSFLSVSTSNDYIEEVMSILKGNKKEQKSDTIEDAKEDSEDIQTNLYETATQETEDFLLKSWQRTGTEFEKVVSAVFEAMGYTTTVTQQSGDHGIDVIAHPDPIGLEKPYIKIQAKSGTTPINEKQLNELKGLLNQGEEGVMVCLGALNSNAKSIERTSPNLTVIDAKKFVKLFIQHYEQLDPVWRTKFPLKKVYVPFSAQ